MIVAHAMNGLCTPEFGAERCHENIIGLVGEGDEMVMLLDIVNKWKWMDEAGTNGVEFGCDDCKVAGNT